MYRSLNLKKIFTKRWPQFDLYFLVQTGSQSLILRKIHISTTTRGIFTIFAPLYRQLFVKKYWYKSDPNLTFTPCPNRKSKFNIFKTIHISTTTKGTFLIFWTIVQIVNCQKIFIKKWPQFEPLIPVQTGCQSLIFTTNHISTTARGKFTIFTPLYRSLIVKK